MPLIHEDLTQQLIGAFYEVHNTVGSGFLESVYAAAYRCELTIRGIPFSSERMFPVHYKGRKVAVFRADLVVADVIIVEFKAYEKIIPAHEAQLLNYLRASRLEVGLIFNFHHKPAVRRLVWGRRVAAIDDGPAAILTPAIP
jgi:GxxExxY protein